jgi:4-amino-4-deoxy-L-arabinose transferase-like glycosyltransferase
MRTVNLSFPVIGLIAATRGMLAAGIALLLADRVGRDKRRAIGWTLAAIGAVTTLPLMIEVASHTRRQAPEELEEPLAAEAGPRVQPTQRGEMAVR